MHMLGMYYELEVEAFIETTWPESMHKLHNHATPVFPNPQNNLPRWVKNLQEMLSKVPLPPWQDLIGCLAWKEVGGGNKQSTAMPGGEV